MATFEPHTVRCPRCERPVQCALADVIDLSADPDLARAIDDGTLHAFDCATCGHGFRVEHPMVILDFTRWLWICVAPEAGWPEQATWRSFAAGRFEATMQRGAAPVVRDDWAPRMTRRLVFGLPALREKLRLLAAGLDDARVEACKLAVIEDLKLPFRPSAPSAALATRSTTGFAPPADDAAAELGMEVAPPPGDPLPAAAAPSTALAPPPALFFERVDGETLVFVYRGAILNGHEIGWPRAALATLEPDVWLVDDWVIDARARFYPRHPPPEGI